MFLEFWMSLQPAGLTFGLDRNHKKNKKEMNILVFNLGGGNFDVSIITIDNDIFEVISTKGYAHLGG